MPTSLVIAVVSSWAGAAIAGSALAYSAITAVSWLTYNMIRTAATLVIGGLLSRSFGSQQSSAGFLVQAQGRDQVVRSTVANRTIVYGRAMVSGPLVFASVTGTSNDTLWLVIPLAGHEIDAVESVWFNDTEIVTSLTTDASTYTVSTGPYAGKAAITFHAGGLSQAADAGLVALGVGWTSNHRLLGVAYIVVKLTWSQDVFPTGIPNVKALIRGKKLYDPRTGLTIWSVNPALAVRDYLTNSYGLETAASEIDSASFIAAANVCEEIVNPLRGPELRYTCNGVLDLGEAPREAMAALLSSMAGNLVWTAGVYQVFAGAYTAPAVTLTASDLAGPVAVRPRVARHDLFNAVRGTFVDAFAYWQPADFPPQTNATYATYDGGQVIWQDITLPYTTSSATAQRLAKLALERSRQGITVELVCKLTTFKVAVMDNIQVTLSQLGWSAKVFKVLAWEFVPDGNVKLTLQEEASATYAWNNGYETVIDPAPDTNLGDPFAVSLPGSLTLASGTAELLRQGDGTVVSRIKATWPAPTDVFSRDAELQWKLTTATDWQVAPIVPSSLGVAWLAPVLDGSTYNTRIRFINTLQVRSAWVNGSNHTVIGKTEPPPMFDFFTVMAQPDGTRQYNFGYSPITNQPADWLGAQIRYTSGTSVTPTWESMTPLQDSATYYTASPQELNSPMGGEWTFACKSLDTSGNESAYRVINITLPSRRLGDVYDEFHEELEGWLGTITNCHRAGTGIEADDSTTWTSRTSWTGYTRWSLNPSSPITYVTPVRDFGTSISGQINATLEAVGVTLQELATSNDGSTWSAWGAIGGTFTARYIKLRLTVTADGSNPVPSASAWGYQIGAVMRTEYINDVVIANLTGAYRIAVGDIRIPLTGTYSFIKRTTITIQDSNPGTWTATRIDQSVSPGPRWQFRYNGTLADPAFVDFYIEGY